MTVRQAHFGEDHQRREAVAENPFARRLKVGDTLHIPALAVEMLGQLPCERRFVLNDQPRI